MRPLRLAAIAEREHLERDMRTLREFASEEMPVTRPRGCQPSVRPLEGGRRRGAPWSRTYRKYPAAVNAHLVKVCRGDLGVALTPQAARFVLDRNESNSGLATKRNKESGRLTLDCSHHVVGRSDEAIPLNTEDVRVEAARRWGTIVHPTSEDLVRMVLRVARRVGWDAVVVWKSDLKAVRLQPQ